MMASFTKFILTSAIGKIPILKSIAIDNSWLIDFFYVCQFYLVKKIKKRCTLLLMMASFTKFILTSAIDKIPILKSIAMDNSWLINRLSPFYFLLSIKCVSWYCIGRSDWKKKNKKKNHQKSQNRGPWYPRTTLKVNIHIFILTKYTIYCEKCSCFCSCFALCCYYAHFSD